MIKINMDSWHYKMVRWVYESMNMPLDLCSYFWRVVACIFMVTILLPGLLLKKWLGGETSIFVVSLINLMLFVFYVFLFLWWWDINGYEDYVMPWYEYIYGPSLIFTTFAFFFGLAGSIIYLFKSDESPLVRWKEKRFPSSNRQKKDGFFKLVVRRMEDYKDRHCSFVEYVKEVRDEKN